MDDDNLLLNLYVELACIKTEKVYIDRENILKLLMKIL